MTERILFVDDEPNVLAGYERQLRREFDLVTAVSRQEALAALNESDSFAVVVADMRMPDMNGIQFLAKVKERDPDIVRMIITGYADVQTAIDAVNEGSIFRFLAKPCPPETLIETLREGLNQYRLTMAERVLLGGTLTGGVQVLSEVLRMVNPAAFSRGHRIRPYVRQTAAKLKLANLWQFDLAAMLSQVGCITIPPSLFEKLYNQVPLSYDEEQLFSSHPSTGRKLVSRIPRLEPIARMIGDQQRPFSAYSAEERARKDPVTLGGQILKTALDFDLYVVQGLSRQRAISALRWRQSDYNPLTLEGLENLDMGMRNETAIQISAKDLVARMFAAEDIYAKNGLQVVRKGQELTGPLIERLRSIDRLIGLREPIRIWMV